MYLRFAALSIAVLLVTENVFAVPLTREHTASSLNTRGVYGSELERGLRPGAKMGTDLETETEKGKLSLSTRDVYVGELERGLSVGMKAKASKRTPSLSTRDVYVGELERGLSVGMKAEHGEVREKRAA
ncbi:hypothetical protein MMC13_005089 [Lambiella insularis]|nr:hypothetical protein [Lambiella insularis]